METLTRLLSHRLIFKAKFLENLIGLQLLELMVVIEIKAKEDIVKK